MSVPSSSPQLPRVVREYIAAEKDKTRVWLRTEMDRLVEPLVDSVFDRLTNKLKLMDMDWDRILPGVASDRARVGQVKREIKEEYEMTMQNVMDNAPEGIVNCVKREIKKEEEDGQMVVIKKEEEEDGQMMVIKKEEEEDGQMMVIKKEEEEEEEGGDEDEMNPNMNNSSDIDSFFARWMRDEVELGEPTRANLELMPISNEPSNQNLTNLVDEESRVNHNTQHQFDEANNNGGMVQIQEEEEVGDVQARVTVMALAANEGANEESSSMEDAQIDTTLPHLTGQTLGMVQQSSQTHSKRNGQSVNNQQDAEDEDDRVDEASRPAKRSRMDTTRPSKATEPTTNPIDANLAQPNGHLQCPHCPKSFICQSKLQRHLRVHTGERPFHCDQCDKRFKARNSLTEHQRIHQDIKPFRCAQCGKQFTRKVYLDSHLLVHSGARPFECRHCEKSFTQLTNRTKHEQAIHLHVKPYRCKQCGHTATLRADVIKHIRVVHFGLPKSIKEQEELNIIDERDPREFVEKV